MSLGSACAKYTRLESGYPHNTTQAFVHPLAAYVSFPILAASDVQKTDKSQNVYATYPINQTLASRTGCPPADNGLGLPSCAAAAAAASNSALYSGVCNAGHTGITIKRGSGWLADAVAKSLSVVITASLPPDWCSSIGLNLLPVCVAIVAGKLGRCVAAGANVWCCNFVPVRSSCCFCETDV
uniref:Uncharacterized protein n=1 Tax=Glossina palpalis gambiensis TaxID=67801 RepID=A0A1B0BE82_9MUSC